MRGKPPRVEPGASRTRRRPNPSRARIDPPIGPARDGASRRVGRADASSLDARRSAMRSRTALPGSTGGRSPCGSCSTGTPSRTEPRRAAQSDLARRAGINPRTVRRALDSLVAGDWSRSSARGVSTVACPLIEFANLHESHRGHGCPVDPLPQRAWVSVTEGMGALYPSVLPLRGEDTRTEVLTC